MLWQEPIISYLTNRLYKNCPIRTNPLTVHHPKASLWNHTGFIQPTMHFYRVLKTHVTECPCRLVQMRCLPVRFSAVFWNLQRFLLSLQTFHRRLFGAIHPIGIASEAILAQKKSVASSMNVNQACHRLNFRLRTGFVIGWPCLQASFWSIEYPCSRLIQHRRAAVGDKESLFFSIEWFDRGLEMTRITAKERSLKNRKVDWSVRHVFAQIHKKVKDVCWLDPRDDWCEVHSQYGNGWFIHKRCH